MTIISPREPARITEPSQSRGGKRGHTDAKAEEHQQISKRRAPASIAPAREGKKFKALCVLKDHDTALPFRIARENVEINSNSQKIAKKTNSKRTRVNASTDETCPPKFRVKKNSTERVAPRLSYDVAFSKSAGTNETAIANKFQQLVKAADTICASPTRKSDCEQQTPPSPARTAPAFPSRLSLDALSQSPILSTESRKSIKTPRMAVVRFSADTKTHDGLCKRSWIIETLFSLVDKGGLASVKDLKSFFTKNRCHDHLPPVIQSIEALVLSLQNSAPEEEIPLLPGGGGSLRFIGCTDLKTLKWLYNQLLTIYLFYF